MEQRLGFGSSHLVERLRRRRCIRSSPIRKQTHRNTFSFPFFPASLVQITTMEKLDETALGKLREREDLTSPRHSAMKPTWKCCLRLELTRNRPRHPSSDFLSAIRNLAKPSSILFSALFLAAASADAAVISWSAPQNIAGDTDVSANGVLVKAVAKSGTAYPTVNGVTFTPCYGTDSVSGVNASNFATGALPVGGASARRIRHCCAIMTTTARPDPRSH